MSYLPHFLGDLAIIAIVLLLPLAVALLSLIIGATVEELRGRAAHPALAARVMRRIIKGDDP